MSPDVTDVGPFMDKFSEPDNLVPLLCLCAVWEAYGLVKWVAAKLWAGMAALVLGAKKEPEAEPEKPDPKKVSDDPLTQAVLRQIRGAVLSDEVVGPVVYRDGLRTPDGMAVLFSRTSDAIDDVLDRDRKSVYALVPYRDAAGIGIAAREKREELVRARDEAAKAALVLSLSGTPAPPVGQPTLTWHGLLKALAEQQEAEKARRKTA